ncbi:MAG: flagellar basal body rod C-terminal domain-containing protein, partial [Porticoccus sp.]
NLFENGSLGGLFSFRSETLDQAQNQIGEMAVSLASGFNTQHKLGVDLNGDDGGDFFSIGAPVTYSNNNNAGTAGITTAFVDTTALTGTDYNLKVSNAATNEFIVSRADDGTSFTAVLDGSKQLSFDGLIMTVDDPSKLVDGDRYQIQPTRGAAGDINNLIHETEKIAAGFAVGSGDNRNALALQDLQESNLVGGSATLSQAYASLVGFVGNQTNIVQINLTAQEGLTNQMFAMQQSESGVNLDEEATNLIRYQQYYQASAKVIEVGGTILDTILGLR